MNGLAGRSAEELLRLLRAREVSALEVVRDHLARIELVDRELGAVLRVNDRAEDDARAVDARIAAGDAGTLAGLPIALKDNLLTAGLATTAGSRILEGFVPARDATVVARIRAAGAVILCKTNLDEFAMGSSTENSAFGPTRNPWDLTRVAGGSSGGSAAAVAAGLAPIALGSDTGGSVRQPAAFCGVVGLKPTYGRVSRFGLVAFGSSLDQIGPMSATVAGCALTLGVIAGGDPADSTSSSLPVPDYRAGLGEGVAGLRIGIAREYFDANLDPQIAGAMRAASAALVAAGARVEEVSLPNTRYSVPAYYLVATAEASSNLARYDGVRYGLRAAGSHSVGQMYRATRGEGFGDEVKRRIMLGTFALSAGYHDAFYGKAQRVRTLLRGDFERVFAAGVDLLLCPTTPTVAFRIGEKVDDPLAMYLSDVYTATANLAGVPAISVPAGTSAEGLPIGAQLLGADFSEAKLLRGAAVIEAALGPLAPIAPRKAAAIP